MHARLCKLGGRSLILLSVTIITSTINTLSGASCFPAPSGLIAWWQAEGTANDTVDGHEGTMMGSASFGAGFVGSYSFALAGGRSFVALPLNLFPYPAAGSTGNTPFSFELWFATHEGGVILGQQDTQAFYGTSAYVPAIYVGTDGKLYVSMFWDFSAVPIVSPTTVNDYAWHHVAVTYDGSMESVYLDGALIGSEPFTQMGYAANYFYQLGAGFTQGWPAGNGGWFNFTGYIDEVSLYNRALTASEVAGIYAAGSAGKCSPGFLPYIINEPVSQIVPLGYNGTFAVYATGATSYQWQFNGVNIINGAHYQGATNSELIILGVGPADVGSYRVVVSNAAGSTNSETVTLTIPQSCVPPPPGLFAWYKAEGNALDSADSHNGALANGVSFVAGKVGQGFMFGGVNDYVILPQNLFPYPTAGSGNTPFSFETWFSTRTGGVILGQQNTAVTVTPSAYVPALYVGTDGRLYVAMFWDNFTRIISPGTVNDGTLHHVAVTYDGTTETVYLDGAVIGSGPFTQMAYVSVYQYQLGVGYTAGLWPAANGGWFFFNGVIDEASIYNRALSAGEVAGIFLAGSAGKCPLSGGQPPQITVEPVNQTVAAGANATFSVTATGSSPLSYQWQMDGINLANSTHYVGATSNTLTIVGVTAADAGSAGSYRVVVSNAFGTTTSSAATLTAVSPTGCTPAPPGLIAWYKAEGNALDSADSNDGSLVNHVQFVQAKVGLGFLFDGQDWVDLPINLFPYPTSGTTGNAPFSFETWFSTTTGGVILGQQEGDQAGTPFGSPTAYVPAVYVGTDGRLYVAMFWDNFAQIISPGTVNDGAFHHVAVTYNGTIESVYLDGRGIGDQAFTQIGYASRYYYQLGTGFTAGLWPAATNGWFFFHGVIDEASVYNQALTPAEVNGIFTAGSGGKCPPSSSGPPLVQSNPASQTVPTGANATFTVTATGAAPLSYQWLFNGQTLINNTHYVGTTSNSLTIVGVTAADAGPYLVVVSNQFGTNTGGPAQLSVSAQGCTPAPAGLIAWYKAEGNALDSADSHNGALYGQVFFQPAKVGLGFGFNGLANCVVLAPNLFPYPTTGNRGNAPFSFETWFSTTAGGVILGQQEGDAAGAAFSTPNAFVPAVYVGHDGRLYVMMFWSDFGQIISSTAVNDGAFHHVAVTYDGTTEVVYLDGTVIGNRFMVQLGYSDSYNYQLGTGYTYGWPEGNPGWFSFNGIIDEASIYNRGLTGPEVMAIVNAGSGGKCP